MLVVFEHFLAQEFESVMRSLGPFVDLGRVGVTAFFIVSGFVIPLSIERSGNLKAFWVGRVFRLYPAYWFSLAGLAILGWLVPQQLASSGAIVGALDTNPVVWLKNISLFQMFLGAPNLIPASWTLGLEWIIYGGCALLYAVKRLQNTRWNTYLLVAGFLVAGVLVPLLIHKRIPGASVILLLTAQVGLLSNRASNGQLERRWAIVDTIVLSASAVAIAFVNYGLYTKGAGEVQLTFLCAVISTFLGYGLFFGSKILFSKTAPVVLIWLGRNSYSLYLTHAAWIVLPSIGNPFLNILIKLAGALATSEVVYRLIEAPAIAYGKTLSKKWLPKRVAPAP